MALLTLVAACSGPAAAQGGLQAGRFFPPPPAVRDVPVDGDVRAEFRNRMREFLKGGALDRRALRQELVSRVDDYLPLILEELEDGNHATQPQLILILMERRDPRTLPALRRLAKGDQRGDRALAALALGRLGTELSADDLARLETELQRLVEQSNRDEERVMGAFALGRLGGPEAPEFLLRRFRGERRDRNREAVVLAMGMHGSRTFHPVLEKLLGTGATGKEGLRRAACVAAGFQPPELARELLRKRIGDSDPAVRRIAFEGLARLGPDPEAAQELMALRATMTGRGPEIARLVLAVGALGRAAVADKLLAWLKDAQAAEEEQAAAVAALSFAGPELGAAAARAHLDAPSDRVRAAAWLVHLTTSRQLGETPQLAGAAGDRDARVRRIGIWGAVYSLGEGARPWLLERVRDGKDDVREHAAEALGWLGRDRRAAAALARAQLQKEWDELGIAPSWNLPASLNGLVLRVLDVEDVDSRSGGGGGAAPGGVATGGQRSAAASATRVSPREEDLHYHLVRHPYFDLRSKVEMPSVP